MLWRQKKKKMIVDMQYMYTERKDRGGEGERRIGRWRKRMGKERKKETAVL